MNTGYAIFMPFDLKQALETWQAGSALNLRVALHCGWTLKKRDDFCFLMEPIVGRSIPMDWGFPPDASVEEIAQWVPDYSTNIETAMNAASQQINEFTDFHYVDFIELSYEADIKGRWHCEFIAPYREQQSWPPKLLDCPSLYAERAIGPTLPLAICRAIIRIHSHSLDGIKRSALELAENTTEQELAYGHDQSL